MKKAEGKLFLVPTPIGNLDDTSPRARSVLESVEIIFCEDTRVAKRFLSQTGIKYKRLTSYNSFNESVKAKQIVKYLTSGTDVALISDAGQPLISDPGYLAVQLAIKNGVTIIPLAGPSAVLTALIASGFNLDSFTFKGFLSKANHGLKQNLINLRNHDHPIVLFESPLRVVKLLEEINELYPTSQVCVAKELTKKHEYFFRGTAAAILAELNFSNLKGEFVVIINSTMNSEQVDYDLADGQINYWIKKGLSVNQAVSVAAKMCKLNRNTLYKKYHEEG